jgi:hypothetical protein
LRRAAGPFHVSHLIIAKRGQTYQKVDKNTSHNKVNDRNPRVKHEPVVDELGLQAGRTLAGGIRLSGCLLSKHLQTGQRLRLRTRSQSGFHGDDAPGPGEGHANQQGQRPQDENEEDARGGIDEENQTIKSDKSIRLEIIDSPSKKRGCADGSQRGMNEHQDSGDPCCGCAAEEGFEVVGIEMEPWWQ